MTEQEELQKFRIFRDLGCIPNPNELTGVRRDLALELERLQARIHEIDDRIFQPGPPESLPKPATQEHVRYMGHYHRGGNFAGLGESINQVFETEAQALDYLNENIRGVERAWCTVMPVVVVTPKVGTDVDGIKTVYAHLFSNPCPPDRS
jgi:hypothetical protein